MVSHEQKLNPDLAAFALVRENQFQHSTHRLVGDRHVIWHVMHKSFGSVPGHVQVVWDPLRARIANIRRPGRVFKIIRAINSPSHVRPHVVSIVMLIIA